MHAGPQTPRAAAWLIGAYLTAGLAGCGGADRPDAVHRALSCRPGGPPAAARPSPPASAVPVRAGSSPATEGVLVRVNQVGWGRNCAKVAYAMSQAPLTGSFAVRREHGGRVVLRGAIGAPAQGVNATWRFVYPLDLSALTRPGRYRVQAGGALSPAFGVGDAAALYSPLVGRAVSFFTEQRDGPDVHRGLLGRQPSHLLDAHASVYRAPAYLGTRLTAAPQPTGASLDVSGGWFDAGDYLKFTQTASFDEALLGLTARDYPEAAPNLRALRGEVAFGARWLLRMWDPRGGVLYAQVGIGDGNGTTVLGDHDLWRLPQADDRSRATPGSPTYLVSHRPVFAANAPGRPISPNLAGRVAGALGLCAQSLARVQPRLARRCLIAGQQIFDRADVRPRVLVSSFPHAYYPEAEWRDDLELGAVELFLATQRLGGAGARHASPYYYLPQAAAYADAYTSSPSDGRDTLNLYDVSALAHYDLARVLRRPATRHFAEVPGVNLRTDARALIRDLHDSLALGASLAGRDPFGLANPAGNVDTVPHALGYAIEARLYDALTRSPEFDRLAQAEIAWVLGANPWGSSFVVGAGSVFPRCLAHQIANLSGSLTGRGALALGATVDGPNAQSGLTALGAPDGYRPCPRAGDGGLGAFDGRGVGYLDDVRSSSTSEPSSDYAALALAAFAQQAEN